MPKFLKIFLVLLLLAGLFALLVFLGVFSVTVDGVICLNGRSYKTASEAYCAGLSGDEKNDARFGVIKEIETVKVDRYNAVTAALLGDGSVALAHMKICGDGYFYLGSDKIYDASEDSLKESVIDKSPDDVTSLGHKLKNGFFYSGFLDCGIVTKEVADSMHTDWKVVELPYEDYVMIWGTH